MSKAKTKYPPAPEDSLNAQKWVVRLYSTGRKGKLLSSYEVPEQFDKSGYPTKYGFPLDYKFYAAYSKALVDCAKRQAFHVNTNQRVPGTYRIEVTLTNGHAQILHHREGRFAIKEEAPKQA